jgi:hypothetical protein
MDMISSADPQPFCGVEAFMIGMPRQIPFNSGMESMSKAIKVAKRDVRMRVTKKQGILPEGAPRLMHETMPYCQPWIAKMFEENGVSLLPGGPTSKELLPPRFSDPYMASAEAWLKRASTVNPGYRATQICERLLKYGFDGVLLGFFDFDRWLGSDNLLLVRMVEERANLPAYYIEGDHWDERDYSPEALRLRVETICEMAKMRRHSE